MAVDKIKISVFFDQNFKTFIKSQELSDKKWKLDYGWMPEYYKMRNDKIDKITELDLKRRLKKEIKDKRSLKPFPNTGNKFYGWVATKDDFQLQIYGPDIISHIALPEEKDWIKILGEDY